MRNLGSCSEVIIFLSTHRSGASFWVAKNAQQLITAIICLSTFYLFHKYAVHITEVPSPMSKRVTNVAPRVRARFFVMILSEFSTARTIDIDSLYARMFLLRRGKIFCLLFLLAACCAKHILQVLSLPLGAR